MDNELLDKLDDVINAFKNSEDIKRFLFLKEKLLSDSNLLKKIDAVKKDTYDSNYIKDKEEILDNEYYKEYKELEKRIFFLVQDINKKLSSLKG